MGEWRLDLPDLVFWAASTLPAYPHSRSWTNLIEVESWMKAGTIGSFRRPTFLNTKMKTGFRILWSGAPGSQSYPDNMLSLNVDSGKIKETLLPSSPTRLNCDSRRGRWAANHWGSDWVERFHNMWRETWTWFYLVGYFLILGLASEKVEEIDDDPNDHSDLHVVVLPVGPG